MKLMVSQEKLQELIDKLKEQNKYLNQKGISRDGVHYNLKIFLVGPTYFSTRPDDCKHAGISFPGSYFTVHVSLDKDKQPILSFNKYFCRSYSIAKSLADKMKNDRGIPIVESTNSESISQSEVDQTWGFQKVRYSKYHGGPTGDLSDDFIDDVLEGNPEAYWNID